MKKLLLVLYSNHMYDQTAYSLNEYFAKNYKNYDVVLVDEQSYLNLGKGKRTNKRYVFSARHFTFANNMFCFCTSFSFLKKGKKFKAIDKVKREKKKFKNWRIRFRKLENVLARFTPSVIVATTPRSHFMLTKCMQRLNINIPFYIVSSDYFFNKAFYNGFSSGYYVQNAEVKQQLISTGCTDDKINIVGSAVLEATFECLDKQEVREKYGIDNTLPIIALTAGRYGNRYIKKYFKMFSEFEEKFNLLVLTGNNKSFIKFINKVCQENTIKRNIFAVEQIAKIGDILSITDVLVTAPTSQVTYEAILRQIPTIVIKPLNKIEKSNLRYLVDKQLAFDGTNSGKALQLSLKLIDDQHFYGESVDKLEDKLNADSTKLLAESLAKIMRQQEPIEPEPTVKPKAQVAPTLEQIHSTEVKKIKKTRFAGVFNKNKKQDNPTK